MTKVFNITLLTRGNIHLSVDLFKDPLITSTFVLYAWGLPNNVAIRIFVFISIKSIYFKNVLVKPIVNHILCNYWQRCHQNTYVSINVKRFEEINQPRSQGFRMRTRGETRKSWSGPVNFAFWLANTILSKNNRTWQLTITIQNLYFYYSCVYEYVLQNNLSK
jgi:hypothetical protein